MRQIGPLFGVSHSAAHRVIDTLSPLLALAPVRRRRVEQIAIVDGTLIPTRDHRLAAPSKNYRYSTNLQIAIDAHTRLVVALCDPQPGNRNDTIAYRSSQVDQKLAGRPVMADDAYRGNPEVIIPYRKPTDGSELPDWKKDLNRQHRTVRAQVEHALARMKTFKILRDYRRRHHIGRHRFRHRPPPRHHPARVTLAPLTGNAITELREILSAVADGHSG
ncbi:transposase [Micromonospora sp. ATCC 39149]|nr:transposase [Micromonospora sp. ATCC 39149]